MSGSIKLWVYIFVGLLTLFFVYKVVLFALGLMSILVPVLAVAAVGVILFAVVNKKGLGPGRRRILP